MDFELQWQWLLWALPLVFALGWVASRWDVRQWQRDLKGSQRIYYKGLNLLLNEQHDKAIDAFIEAVQQDPDTSDLHFALGNLFRRRGEYERAVRVHQHLLGRADLAQSERDRAQHALAQDFMKAGLFDRAEQGYAALAGTAFDTEARLALLDIHERSRDWRAALDVAQRLEASGAGSFASRIAHYWCEIALEADAAPGDASGDRSVALAREAAPGDARPLVLAGERAATRGDHADALRAWTTLMAVRPAAFNLVARRHAVSARALGMQAQALEQVRALYEQTPTMELLEALASLDDDPAAGRTARLGHLREHPSLAAAGAVLSALAESQPGAPTGPVELVAVRDAVRRAARPLHRYRCAACGFEAERYFWHCPGCLGWDTYPPQRLEDL